MKKPKTGYLIAFFFLVVSFVLIVLGRYNEVGWLLMCFFVTLGLAFRSSVKLKGFTFTTWIFAAVGVAMFYPQYFLHLGHFKMSGLIIPLLEIIMFGMGCELSVKDL